MKWKSKLMHVVTALLLAISTSCGHTHSAEETSSAPSAEVIEQAAEVDSDKEAQMQGPADADEAVSPEVATTDKDSDQIKEVTPEEPANSSETKQNATQVSHSEDPPESRTKNKNEATMHEQDPKVNIARDANENKAEIIKKENEVIDQPWATSRPSDEEDALKKEEEYIDDPAGEPVGLLIPDHSKWQIVLTGFVNDGGVDYARLKVSPGNLHSYLEQLKVQTNIKSWSRDEQMAFWLNAYNAFTVKLIVDNYPLNSITDLDGGKVWDRRWIELDGQMLSLNQIEHEIIRPTFQDARIHFALNCAAKSCPPLSSRAFTTANLEQELGRVTNDFLSDKSSNVISSENLKLSQIFEWYAEDFGDLRSWLSQYTDTDISKAAIEYNAYDWRLNRQ